jgi:ankyrin repeat protein
MAIWRHHQKHFAVVGIGLLVLIPVFATLGGCGGPASEQQKPAGDKGNADATDGDKATNDAAGKEAAQGPKVDPKINELDEGGFSKLHHAAMRGDAQETRKLLEAGADPNVRQGPHKGAPLQYAAAGGRLEVVRILLKQGAVVDAADADARTPLMWAAQNGQTDVVTTLLDAGADLAASAENGRNSLQYAAEKGHADVVRVLLDRWVKQGGPDEKAGALLIAAVQSGQTDMVKMLVDAGVDLTARAKNGWTPLHYAVSAKDSDTAQLLLDHGVLSQLCNHPSTMRLVLEPELELRLPKVDVSASVQERPAAADESINQLDNGGFSKLHRAAMAGNAEAALELLKDGADPNVEQGTHLGAPLQYAAARGHIITVLTLLRHGAKVDSEDDIGRTPLAWAAEDGRPYAAKILLDAGADPNIAGKGDWTPLHRAARKGNLRTARLLIKHGASVEARNSIGQSPLDLDSRLESEKK